MKQIRSTLFIEKLQADTRSIILAANQLSTTDPEFLLTQPAPDKWSVVQILEHLNSYSRYYLPALEKALQANKPAIRSFTPGWLGAYFTRIMKPNENGKIVNKMKAPKDHRPAADLDIKPVMSNFLLHQHLLLDLLETAKTKDINSIRVPISIAKFIKLKAGDVFGFFIAHEQRHFIQIANTIASLKNVTGKFRVVHPAVLQ